LTPSVEDLRFEFENMSVGLVATRNIPRIETSGILVEETEAGGQLTATLWIARELVEAGLARFADDGVSGEEWTQIHYRELYQPHGRPSPLPEKFYQRAYLTFSRLAREAAGDEARMDQLDRLRGRFRDIMEARIGKVARMASAEVAAASGALQPEEAALYGALHGLISSWRGEMRRLEAR